MREGDALLCGDLSEAQAHRIVVLLASMGLESVVDADAHGALAVFISSTHLDAARRVLSEEQHAPAATELPLDTHELAASEWFGRGSGAVLAMAAVCVAMFSLSLRGEDLGMRSHLLALGAIDRPHVAAGEYWRLLTAVFLHFDIGHLLGNLAVLVVVGPPLAHLVGPWLFLLVFLTSGVGANVASYLIAPTLGLKAGASGAIAGVLGALGGQALPAGPTAATESLANRSARWPRSTAC